jgi:hypothetical protein
MTTIKDHHRFGDGPFDVLVEETIDGDAVLFEKASLLRVYALFDVVGFYRYQRVQVRRSDLTLPDPMFGDELSGRGGDGMYDIAIKADQHSEEIVVTGLRAREVKRALDKLNLHRHRQMVIERNDHPVPTQRLIQDTKERSDHD